MEPTNPTPLNPPKTAELENRREALRKLGKYAAYAAPLTLIATAKAQQSGIGSGGRIPTPPSS